MSDHAAPDAPVNELDQKAELLRTFSQKAGISSRFDSWTDLSDRRKDQWRSMAAAMIESGYTIAPAGDVLTAEDRAAIGRLCKLHMADTVYASAVVSKRTTSEEQDASWELMNKARKAFTAEDFKRLRALAAGGTA